MLTERFLEKHAKKLIGRTDLEDALERLDKLTHELAQMPTAEVQRATGAIDETMGEDTGQVLAADDRVASTDDKVAGVINGAQIIVSQLDKCLI